MKIQLSKLAGLALAMPRSGKRLMVLLVDFSLCLLTVWLAYYLRLGEFISLLGSSEWAQGAIWASIVSVGIALPIFVLAGLYRAIFRYSGWPALLAVARAVCIYGLLYASIFTVVGIDSVPRTVGIIQPILLLLSVGLSRALARVWLGDEYLTVLKRASRPKVLIYGAGTAGRQLAAAMANNQEMQVTGFLDDDDRLHGQVLNGHSIYDPADLDELVTTLNISSVLLAMPSVSRKRRNEILSRIRDAHVAVRTLPSVNDIALGKVTVLDVRDLDIDDLLGREPVAPNHILLAMKVRNKVVVVTGAGGSIGSELCRQILSLGPRKLLLIEHSEFALFSIHQEIEERRHVLGLETVVIPLLASVQDEERLREIMSTWAPDTVYHAAAYKHVPLVEHNPAEGVKNNVFGTLRAAQAAVDHGVSNFVLVSTDKAVRPANVMGASKRLAEMALQALAAEQRNIKGRTILSMVRFGNVLGSSGSVVPKFRDQIRHGGPITLTHADITRYFMTIPEASQLVIQAGAIGRGGDVFVLDMGEPVRILDLAHRMVDLSGLKVKDDQNPEGDIEIETTGLRPGEKLFEELLIGDNPERTTNPRILRAREEFLTWQVLAPKLKALELALSVNDVRLILTQLRELVTGYVPSENVVDWVLLEQELETGSANS
jgi:FlaA1/EpsC-like NDP-sugar epimerase